MPEHDEPLLGADFVDSFSDEETPKGQPENPVGANQKERPTVWEQVSVLERATDDIIDRVALKKVDVRADLEKRRITLARAHHTEMMSLVEKQERERVALDDEFDNQFEELDTLLRRAAGRQIAR